MKKKTRDIVDGVAAGSAAVTGGTTALFGSTACKQKSRVHRKW